MPLDLSEDARFLKCDYALKGLPVPRCPECGQAFDVDDPRTYFLPNASWSARHAQPPPKWFAVLAFAILGTALMNSLSIRFAPLTMTPLRHWSCCFTCRFIICCVTVSGLIALDYGLRIYAIRRLRRLTRKPMKRQRHVRRWRAIPICLGLALLFSTIPITHVVLFNLSRGAFERELAQIQAVGRGTLAPRRVGLYHIDRISVRNDQSVVFCTARSWGPRHEYHEVAGGDSGIMYVPSQQYWRYRNSRLVPSGRWSLGATWNFRWW